MSLGLLRASSDRSRSVHKGKYGGLGLGTIYTSLAFLTVIIAFVAWLSFEGERAGKTQTLPSN